MTSPIDYEQAQHRLTNPPQFGGKPSARYRVTVRRDEDSKMCDFAVLATTNGHDRAAVIELKRRIADWPHAGEQLGEGLRALHEKFDDTGLVLPLRACLAVGKQASQLRNLLRSHGVCPRFGSRPVSVEVVDCGSALNVSHSGPELLLPD